MLFGRRLAPHPRGYDRPGLQARRILLVFAIVLLLTAAAASIMPVPEETAPEDSRPPEPEAVEPPPELGPDNGATEVEFSARGKPHAEPVELGTHAVVTVEAPKPGEIELAGLGRIAPVERRTPATFDLFTDRPGRFRVVYTPVRGPEQRVGTLVVGGAQPTDGGTVPRSPQPVR